MDQVSGQRNNRLSASVHAGEQRQRAYHSVVDPIVQSSNFAFENTADIVSFMEARAAGDTGGRVEYGRYGNPTVRVVEERMAALEGTEDAVAFSSGMAAISTALLTFLKQGDHVILTDDCYRRTREFVLTILARFGVTASVVPINDFDALRRAVTPATRVFFSETPTNPYLRVLDLAQWCAAARVCGAITMLDATFATPVNLRPTEWGVDLVLHSATKYLGGHNDLLAGIAAGSTALISRIRDMVFTMGPILDPQSAFLLLRGIKTLGLRVGQQNRNGQRLADFLRGHPAVEQVWYPGCPDHQDHATAQRQMSGFGGVVSFTVKGDFTATSTFLDQLKIPYLTPSLGAVESLATQPALMSYANVAPEERKALGVVDNLVRYAVGIEDVGDIIADIDQALKAAVG
ncbi:MAG: aminotransferase class I/II-fold pyridoxal phosphate-dependent enzyme [Anaerolineae bacterium]|nr:aminotransferase class I/II-fold pyridoxal phosphate-dependent enzyme [Anaerolineae bacterium]